MNDVAIQSDDVEPTYATTTLTQEPRWPMVYAFLTCWIYPATTARRTAHAPLWQAWLIHFCSAIVIFFSIMMLVAYSETQSINVKNIFDRFVYLFIELFHEFQRNPVDIIAVIFFITLGIQIVFIVIPFFLMAWGAKDEPLKASYRNALRQLWIRTAHIVVGLMMVGTIGVSLGIAKNIWLDEHPTYNRYIFAPSAPTIRPSDPEYSKVHAEYLAAAIKYKKTLKQNQQTRDQLNKIRPYYIEYVEPIVILSSFITALWVLLALLRSLGATRSVLKIDRPPLCEACGYNLTSIPLDSRCPECGEYVIDSLGPEARAGTLWEKQYQSKMWKAWSQSFLSPIRSSQPFGRQIQVTPFSTAHRTYFAMHLPMIFFIGVVSVFFFAIGQLGISIFYNSPSIAFMMMCIFGIGCVIGTIIVTLFAGWLIGWAQSLRHKRNLMPISMQAACYLTGYLMMWAIFSALNLLFIFILQEMHVIREINYMTGMYRETIKILMFFVPNTICGVYYLLLVARVTSGAWYANR